MKIHLSPPLPVHVMAVVQETHLHAWIVNWTCMRACIFGWTAFNAIGCNTMHTMHSVCEKIAYARKTRSSCRQCINRNPAPSTGIVRAGSLLMIGSRPLVNYTYPGVSDACGLDPPTSCIFYCHPTPLKWWAKEKGAKVNAFHTVDPGRITRQFGGVYLVSLRIPPFCNKTSAVFMYLV